MIMFEEIFEKVLKKEGDKYSNKLHLSNIFLFTQHFFPNIYKTRNTYSWQKHIKYKFFILNNFLRIKYSCIDDIVKDRILTIFSTVQKHIMVLYRFKNICLFKTKTFLDEPQDLQFNLLSEMPKKHTIDIIQSGIKHQFSIFDLIRIINTSLSYEYNFFTDPKKIKNPWNNIPFTISNLYNIYFFVQHTNIKIPLLFSRFFQSNFCLEHFENHNQFIIKNYIIENCHTFNKIKKLSHIYNMIDLFNSKRIKYRIVIEEDFPEDRLLEIMEPYLKVYLHAAYSYENDLMIKYRNILINKLRQFHKNNPFFGRKIRSLHLRKLFYVSCLCYKEKISMFLPHNIYLPPPSMITLEKKCYHIDYIEPNNIYTILPDYDNVSKYTPCILDIGGIIPIIKNFIFTNGQQTILRYKYYSFVKEKFQIMNTYNNDMNTYNNDMIIETDTGDTGDETDETEETDETDETEINNEYTNIEFSTYIIDDMNAIALNRLTQPLNITPLFADVDGEFIDDNEIEGYIDDDSV